MKAILQGEFHVSASDREAVIERLDDDVDALFIERREDRVSPDRWSLGYLLFLFGALLSYWFQDVLNRGPRIEDEVDIPTFDEIDTPLPELYDRFFIFWILPTGLLASIIFIYGVFVPKMIIPFVSVPSTVNSVFTVIVKPMAVVAAPVVFSKTLIYLEERYLGSRDGDMADSITEVAENNGFQTVVVSCGEAHLDRLQNELEERNWDVDVRESHHTWAAGIWR